MVREKSSYIELHARSAFSFLHGASQPETLIERSAELGMPMLGLCDRNGFYGSARAHYKAKELGVRAIVGVELTLEDGSVLPLLVRERVGYQNLCQLLTRSHLRGAKGESQIRWEELEEFAEGLVALTGDEEGPVRGALERGQREEALAAVERLVRIFGRDHTYIELQRHHLRGEEWGIRHLLELAERFQLRPLATNGVGYAHREGRLLYDAFSCLRHYTTLDEAGQLLSRNAERYLKNGAQMRMLFRDLPEAVDNTLRLAEELDFGLENLGYKFPTYPAEAGESQAQILRRETYLGAKQRYGGIDVKVRKQLEHELKMIEKLGFSGYFLIVWQIVNFAREHNVMVQGRGSAANSAVCYSLGITACDPIGYELLFERFLSEGRNSWPDIDLDLPSGDRREAVIQEVYRRYAPHGAAMTANVITYRGRSAMREMGKVLSLPEDTLSRFSDLYASGDFPHTLELTDQIAKAGLPSQHPRLPALVNLFKAVHGMPRHLGQHSGGMIISNTGLDSIVPLENASMPGRVVAQWDKDDCEDLGIIKVDLLGLGMMAAIQDSVELCRARGPEREFDPARLPQDDPATYQMMQEADTVGVFQIESRAQMATLPRMRPDKFYDLVVEVAIIRPGPIVGKMVHPFINRRRGREKIEYIADCFEPVLKRTLGVPLFQEQVLQMSMLIADFSGSEAEELRRAISFNRSNERMQKVIKKLRAAMTRKGVEQQIQDRIEQSICSFALYGFPESHAISFAMLAYTSVWLKVHRTVEFYTALLNNQPMGFYSPSTLVKDAQRHGVRVRPVSVIESDCVCTVESDSMIRLGLNQVHGLSKAGAERIVQERELAGWQSLEEFLLRVRLAKDELRVLAKIGALNGLVEHRREALWKIEAFHDPDDLFGRAMTQRVEAARLARMKPAERLVADYDGLSLTTGPHPMAYIRDQLPSVTRAMDLRQLPHGSNVTIAGLVICRQRPGTAKGNLFISLEDETGVANAFVPAAAFEKHRLTITQEAFLMITGHIQNADNVVSVYSAEVEGLPYGTALHTESHDFH